MPPGSSNSIEMIDGKDEPHIAYPEEEDEDKKISCAEYLRSGELTQVSLFNCLFSIIECFISTILLIAVASLVFLVLHGV